MAGVKVGEKVFIDSNYFYLLKIDWRLVVLFPLIKIKRYSGKERIYKSIESRRRR
jgi:hypothetical protein